MRNMSRAQRFGELVADRTLPEQIVQRLTDGESLKEMAHAWDVSYRRLVAWIAANGDLTEQCKRARELAGIEFRLEGLEIIDAATGDDVEVAKERAQYRERLSRDLHKSLFGKFTQHQHTHTLDLGERLRRARERVIVDQAGDQAPLAGAAPVLVNPDPQPAPAGPALIDAVIDAELI